MKKLRGKKLVIFLATLIILTFLLYILSNYNHNSKSSVNFDWYKICDQNEQTEKKKCWERAVEDTLTKHGTDTAFDLVDFLYQKDPLFASDCHSYIHLIGQRAYQLFSENEPIRLSLKSASCGYGFYHGFMETLLLSGKNINQAGEFCDWAEKQVGGKNDVKGACFHGIGHGITENHDKKLWLDENELVDGALLICEKVTQDEYMINRCASGVFNVLAIKYNSSSVPLNHSDPLAFCKLQTKYYFKKPCFEEMNTMLISISKKDLLAAAKYLDEIEDQYAIEAMRSLAGVVGMGYKQDSFSVQIQNCRLLPARFHLPCIKGFASGLIEGEALNSQEVRVLSFCSDLVLNADERVSCYQEALRILGLYLPVEKYKDVCSKLDQKYQNYCST